MTQAYWKNILVIAFLLYFALNGFVYFFLEEQLGLAAASLVLTVKLLPLAAFYPLLIKPNYKASLFFCLLLMIYFIFAVLNSFGKDTRSLIAILESVMLVVLFSASFALGKSHK